MNPTLSHSTLDPWLARLARLNAEFAKTFPGESGRRQPVHTVYGGAHLFKRDTARRLGQLAARSLDAYAPDPATLNEAVGLPDGNGASALAATIYRRVREKIGREPVEDFRIDFEDGYGNRTDAEEDGHAVSAAREVAAGLAEGVLPPFIGIRIKPFTEDLKARSLRTLDLFVTAMAEAGDGKLPPHFFVTLPKVGHPEPVAVLAEVLATLERKLGLPEGSLPLEIMIESPQSIVGPDGTVAIPAMVAAANGRCVAAHFGTYDYTASVQITAEHQHMTHPACDFARHAMQVSLSGTGVWLSDGATNVLPVAPNRAAKDGPPLTSEEQAENRRVVHAAWRLHYEHVRHSLVHAYYQGWDLHPAQLPTRYAAVYGFFLEGLESAGGRLSNFVGKAAQATLVGDVFDDAATGQGLLNYFLRAMNCGAISEEEATVKSGLTKEELESRSFLRILEGRRG